MSSLPWQYLHTSECCPVMLNLLSYQFDNSLVWAVVTWMRSLPCQYFHTSECCPVMLNLLSYQFDSSLVWVAGLPFLVDFHISKDVERKRYLMSEPMQLSHTVNICWRYLTRGLIWHLSQSSIRPSIYFSSSMTSRSNHQPVLSNKGKVSCSCSWPLMGLEPTTSTLRVRRNVTVTLL